MNFEIRLPLTDLQRKVLEFIFDFIHRQLYPPTVQEIQNALAVGNPGTVHKTIQALEKKGYLEKTRRTVRGLRLTPVGEAVGGGARQLSFDFGEALDAGGARVHM